MEGRPCKSEGPFLSFLSRATRRAPDAESYQLATTGMEQRRCGMCVDGHSRAGGDGDAALEQCTSFFS